MSFTQNWRPSCLALLLAVLLVGPPVTRGEMRKSWQAKSVDMHAQLLKTARLEEPPSAKPPEAIAEDAVDVTEQPAAEEKAQPKSTAPVRSVQFSSRVRNKNGVVKPAVPGKPIDGETPSPGEERDRAEPLHLEPNLDEIQVDDATVQDDDDDEEDDDDDDEDDELLGWGEQVAKHGKEFDLIDNILEEVDGRVKQQTEKTKETAQGGLASGATKDAPESKAEERLKEYTFPPVLNLTIDEPNSIVRVKLNQDVVRDMLSTGRQGGGIGGKKMLRYILPLFILPFLIQSAVIPFMLTAVKLFLMKSLMAGKVAIFLLLLGAFKNFTKKEARDVYVKDVPDRRYEPSSEGFAYLAEGRPSNWVN
uniref:Protein osiris 22 n=1 Tax=Anopheles atroparvus TaxID=41427 RepID=A0AAG5CTU1_ANOAO